MTNFRERNKKVMLDTKQMCQTDIDLKVAIENSIVNPFMNRRNTTENKIVVENGKIKTILNERTIKNGYMPIEDARRLSHERLNKRWDIMHTNGN